ncbi:MAG TPA: hypothetical protein DDX14_07040, partial [Cyanobacteria bacterium UBA9579]|nr:hypothetical protein [Cyanobacteria bacterium UBA9579]
MKIITKNELTEDFFKYKDFPDIEIIPEIISNVKSYGDKSIIEYSKKFGDGEIKELAVSQAEIDKALEETPADVIDSLNTAIKNIRNFAETQFDTLKDIEIDIDGIKLGHKVIPLNRIGAYVPGGNYPL